MTAEQMTLDEVDAHADATWRATAMQALEHLARRDGEFQAHDLIELGCPEPAHPNHWGPLLHAAKKAGLIEQAGVAMSKRPETRGSLVRTWRGVRRGR